MEGETADDISKKHYHFNLLAFLNPIKCITELLPEDFSNYCHLDVLDSSSILILTVLWCFISVQMISLTKPLRQKLNLTSQNHKKMAESVWKFFIYTGLWLFNYYILFSNSSEDYYYYPRKAWEDWQEQVEISKSIYCLYMFQLSLYLYLVTTIFKEEQKERYSTCLMFRNVLMLILVGLLFTLSYYQVGLLLFFLLDGTFSAMEFMKINVYLEKCSSLYRFLANILFFIYSSMWFIVTIYLFPMKLLLPAIVVSFTKDDLPVIGYLIVLIFLLEIHNVYWLLVIFHWVKKQITIWIQGKSRNFIVKCIFHHKFPPFYSQRERQEMASSQMVVVRHRQHRPFLKMQAPLTSGEESQRIEARENAKALVQTIRCVMLLKRKLKKRREEKGYKDEAVAEEESEEDEGEEEEEGNQNACEEIQNAVNEALQNSNDTELNQDISQNPEKDNMTSSTQIEKQASSEILRDSDYQQSSGNVTLTKKTEVTEDLQRQLDETSSNARSSEI